MKTNIKLEEIFENINTDVIFVIDQNIPKSKYTPLNLSFNNSELDTVNTSSAIDLENYINSCINSNHSLVAYGGYLEKRTIYQRSDYFKSENNLPAERNIHLGIDIWSAAGTTVLAALDGHVHSFNNNNNHGDYGPTLILKHQYGSGNFYTLYGHLSLNSITDIEEGKVIKQGQKIGELGSSAVNGDYPPHLHFQIIKDIETYQGDYPGVCADSDLTFYKSNCPDPLLLLGLK